MLQCSKPGSVPIPNYETGMFSVPPPAGKWTATVPWPRVVDYDLAMVLRSGDRRSLAVVDVVVVCVLPIKNAGVAAASPTGGHGNIQELKSRAPNPCSGRGSGS